MGRNHPPMKQTRRIWKTVLVAAMAFISSGVTRAAEDASTALNNALDLVEGHEARKAVAVLADAEEGIEGVEHLGGVADDEQDLGHDVRPRGLVTAGGAGRGSIAAGSPS